MRIKNSLLLLFAAVLLFSCDKKRVFDEYKSLGSAWNKDSIVSFDFEQKDVTNKYDLYINIRNNEDYRFNNLYLIVALENPKGLTKVDTLQYAMTNPDGTLLGEGFTSVKESKLFYKEQFKFDVVGNYKIKIQHAVRKTGKEKGETVLEGVTDVGFRIENNKNLK